ncbi:MAG TPA: TonB-dependent receptor [Gemmatimonadales bacterium]|nr:TonB-dependent receptor [Gemmatimonadales bacterium]
MAVLAAVEMLLVLQVTQPAVTGTVRDGESGEPLAQATVALADLDRSVISDAGGRYRFLAVPPGPQHLTVRRVGYAPRTLDALVPAEGELEINIALRPAPMQLPAIVVRSRVSLRGLDVGDTASFPDRSVSMAAVRNDPRLSEPDGLLALSGGEIGASPESPSGVHLRGAASDQTGYLLDGIPVFSPYHSAGTFSAWNPDALERLEASSSSPSPVFPDALAGTVAAVTRTPGPVVRGQGGVSTTQAHVAFDGPIGGGGAGYLVSARGGFPELVAPHRDPSYVRGQTRDLVSKLESPLLGGRVHLLLYDSGNRIDAAAAAPDSVRVAPLRNSFRWHSRSMGAGWTGAAGSAEIRIQAWGAWGEADAMWAPDSASVIVLAAERRDLGLLGVVERRAGSAISAGGLRIQASRTSYRVEPVTGASSGLALRAETPTGTVFLQHQRALGRRLTGNLALSATAAAGGVRLNPQTALRWRPSAALLLTATYARAHQFSQSLRNSESVVGNVFPADLYIGAGAPGVPVARSDRGVLALDYRPRAGIRLGVQAYLSEYAGLVLVAPRTAEPFATSGFATGSGIARGFSIDAVQAGTRYGLLASYGWQRIRLEHADSSYTPEYGTSHLFELGAVIFPSATSSIRLAATGAIGRSATGIAGAFEWESCNLLDRGCEFGGSPRSTGALGHSRLPAYVRLDLSVRKHWHVNLGGRDVMLAVFGAVSNLLGRTNVLAFATDPATGQSAPVEMRPFGPLVAGLDWRF